MHPQNIFALHFVALFLTKQSPMLLFSGWPLPNRASSHFEPHYRVERKRGMKTCLFKLQTGCYSRSRSKAVLDGFKKIEQQSGEDKEIWASCNTLIYLSHLLCCSQTCSVIWEKLSYWYFKIKSHWTHRYICSWEEDFCVTQLSLETHFAV